MRKKSFDDFHPDPKQINWIQDPHLRDKFVFDNEFGSFKKWSIIVFVVLALVGTVWYFSPHIAAVVHENSVQSSTIATSVNTSSLVTTVPTTSETSGHNPSVATNNNGLAMPATIESPPTSSQTTEDAERQAMVKKMLARAEVQLTKLRLTSPEGDNAHQTYQELLPIAPDEAQVILDKIIDWYITKGNKYLKEGKLTEPVDKNAYFSYQRIIEIDPNNARAKTLFTLMLETLYARAEEQQRQNHLIEPAGDNLYETYQELVKINPNDVKTQELARKIVTPLLESAQKQMAEQQYTTPEEDNALSTYQEVLALFPEDEQALAGLNEIVEQYYDLALRSQKRGSKESTLEMIEKGLSIDADNEKLLNLKVNVSEK